MALEVVQKRPLILMCPPAHYKIPDPDSQFGHPNAMAEKGFEIYKQDPELFKKKAQEQWENLKETLEKIGVDVVLLEAQENLSDQVFTADASLSLRTGNKEVSLIALFSHPLRQGETEHHQKIIQSLFKDRPFVKGVFPSEGTGDNVYDAFRDVYWSGFNENLDRKTISAGRSNQKAHQTLAHATGVEVISLELCRPFFHVDTTMAPLNKGHVLCYPGGVSEKALAHLKETAFTPYGLKEEDYFIKVTQEEALKFGCNVINIGNHIIIPDVGDRLVNLLKDKGYQVHVVDLSYFIYAGGGPHCLTNNLTQERVVGGLYRLRKQNAI